MEPKKYVKVQATLERCSFGDISSRGKLMEHRMFFLANEVSKEMDATWTINDTSSYERQQLMRAIAKGMLFKLSELHTGLNFHFQLILREADPYDLLYRADFMKLNATYYILGDHNIITGPMYIHESDDPKHIKSLIQKKQLYVPTSKQLYEEYKKQKSA